MENTSESNNVDSEASQTNNTPPSTQTSEPTNEPIDTPTTTSIPVTVTSVEAPTLDAPQNVAPESTPVPTPSTPPAPSTSPTQSHSRLKLVALVIAGLVVLGGAAAASYFAGKHTVKPAATMPTATAMAVPAGATIIEQCEPGLGTQYILPKNIPDGPVYNVYQGKLIGIEYMTDLATLEKLNTTLSNLPLYGQKYDHINVMSMPAHSGFPTPHYQVDVMMVPVSVTDKITCSSSSSSMSDMSSGSSMNSSSSTKSTSSTTSSSKM